jgi:hypothetical protein
MEAYVSVKPSSTSNRNLQRDGDQAASIRMAASVSPVLSPNQSRLHREAESHPPYTFLHLSLCIEPPKFGVEDADRFARVWQSVSNVVGSDCWLLLF